MQLKEALKIMIKGSGLKRKEIAKKLGRANQTTISQWFYQDSIGVKTLCEICDALDYEVVIRPKNYLRLVEREMIIDSKGSTESVH